MQGSRLQGGTIRTLRLNRFIAGLFCRNKNFCAGPGMERHPGLCAPRQKFRAPGLKRTLVWVPEHGKKARKLPVCEIATRSNNRTCHSGEPGKIRKSHNKDFKRQEYS